MYFIRFFLAFFCPAARLLSVQNAPAASGPASASASRLFPAISNLAYIPTEAFVTALRQLQGVPAPAAAAAAASAPTTDGAAPMADGAHAPARLTVPWPPVAPTATDGGTTSPPEISPPEISRVLEFAAQTAAAQPIPLANVHLVLGLAAPGQTNPCFDFYLYLNYNI